MNYSAAARALALRRRTQRKPPATTRAVRLAPAIGPGAPIDEPPDLGGLPGLDGLPGLPSEPATASPDGRATADIATATRAPFKRQLIFHYSFREGGAELSYTPRAS